MEEGCFENNRWLLWRADRNSSKNTGRAQPWRSKNQSKRNELWFYSSSHYNRWRSEKLYPSVRVIKKDSTGDDSTKVSYTFKQVEDEVGGKKKRQVAVQERWRRIVTSYQWVVPATPVQKEQACGWMAAEELNATTSQQHFKTKKIPPNTFLY